MLLKKYDHMQFALCYVLLWCSVGFTLRWRHNGRDSVSNHQPYRAIIYSTVYSDADERKHQSSASLAFVWGIHRSPVNSPHKWPVTRKMFPFHDVIKTHILHGYFRATDDHRGYTAKLFPFRCPLGAYILFWPLSACCDHLAEYSTYFGVNAVHYRKKACHKIWFLNNYSLFIGDEVLLIENLTNSLWQWEKCYDDVMVFKCSPYFYPFVRTGHTKGIVELGYCCLFR